ncbi:protein croquemort-like [Brevipalpus obovatus]|uniref:protein croquemort-like n=1 Tax=Brevipalpus obovatus TaxID=246614 RepID=UPI003D9E51D6
MTYRNRNCVITSLISIGLFFSITSIISYLFSPILIKHMVKKGLVLSSESSPVYPGWSKAPVPIYMKIYVFNITNAHEVATNKSEVKLQELGPYVFIEEREKINITWDHSQGTISYHQKKNYYFSPELTNGSLDDVVYHVNVPLASLVARSINTGDTMLPNLVNSVTEENEDNALFLKHKVGEILFEGYVDSFLDWTVAEGLSPVNVTRFGFFYGRNGSISDGLYTIYTGEANNEDKFGEMFSWENKTEFHFWNDSVTTTSQCNQINESWPGELRPVFPALEPVTMRLFMPELCRWMTLSYLERTETLGLETLRYWAAPSLFDYNIPENKCYCLGNVCPANGVYNTSACTHGSPVFISFPHYLYADPIHANNIKGLKPDPSKHIFYMDMEPKLGVPIDTHARIQVNVFVYKSDNMYVVSDLISNLMIPAIWSETTAMVSSDNADQLKLLHKKVPRAIAISSFVQITLAVLLLIAAIACTIQSNVPAEKLMKPNRTSTPNRPARKEYKAVVTTSFT